MSLQRDFVKARQRGVGSDTFVARPSGTCKSISFSNGGRLSPSGEPVYVAVRVRPPCPGEAVQEVVAMNPSDKSVYVKDRIDDQHVFSIDMPVWSCGGKALDGSAPISQAALYEMVGRPLLDHALDGFNSTLLAYGQTGSGKTYTMMGNLNSNLDDHQDASDSSEEGIIPRLCREMFEQIQNRSFTASSCGTISWEVHVSFVEVYCEKIYDLLNNGTPVSLREEAMQNETYFTLIGARRVQMVNTADILRALTVGNKYRKTAATAMHERSSRSHAVFILELTEILSFTNPEGDVVGTPSKNLSIRLVDLAGSERIGDTGAIGQRFKEGVEINLSLLTLGMVIESLSDPKRRNIRPPYRDSTLTKMLKDAFGGNSKTTLICTISPAETHRAQTIQTLQYGSKARRVVNKPRVEVDLSAVALCKANKEMLALRKELSEARERSAECEERGHVQNLKERLQREQELSRRRKANLERKEAELAEHSQKMEEQRLSYEHKLRELEAEVERVRVRQKERAMQKAERKVESIAEECVRKLDAQREAMENEFNHKEEKLLREQKETEERLLQLDNVYRSRIEELLKLQKELENVVKEREGVASQRERELQEKQRNHEEETQILEQRILTQESEFGEKQKTLEEQLHAQEEYSQLRLDEGLEKLHLLREETANREREWHCKSLEAQRLTRQLQESAELRELEFKQEREEVQREEQRRERDLDERLHQVEHEARIQRETLQRELEVNASITLDKERNIEIHWTLIEEGLRRREELLQKREEEVNARLGDALRSKQEWEKTHREKVVEADAHRDEVMRIIRSKEILIQQRENELNSLAQQLELQAAAQGIDAKHKEHELNSKINEAEFLASRGRRAAERVHDGLKNALARLDTERKQREERLAIWEEEAKNRYAQLENSLAERETVIQRREADVTAQELELEQRRQKEEDLKFREESQQTVGEIMLDKNARSEAAMMLEADSKFPLTPTNCNARDSVARLRAIEEALFQRRVSCEESTEAHERNALVKDEECDWNILMRDANMAGRYMKLLRRECASVCEEQKSHRKRTALLSWMQFPLLEMEQRCRTLLESSRYCEYDLICALETSARRPCSEDVRSVYSLVLEKDLLLRAEGLQVEEERLTQRVSAFAEERATWELKAHHHDSALLAYIVELESLHRAGVCERETEGRAVWAHLCEIDAVHLQHGQREHGLLQMEENIAQQMAETEQQLQKRASDIDRRWYEASAVAMEKERKLQGKESDLITLVAKNEEVEWQIKGRDAELQQQQQRYVGLRKMLEEREALLRRERAHRMDGKESATRLADDLLDVNDFLKEQLGLWIKKYQVLKSEEKVECERCSWQNNRDATVCRCCGNAQLI